MQACWPALQAAGLRTDAAGLRAYQLNARATAQRVLASTYPTVAAMLGEEALHVLAHQLWQAQPPGNGDLGEWGAGLPELLASHADLNAWPWLADSARLDWARHLSARAADAELDAPSLHKLGLASPVHLWLRFKPCVQLVTSVWPIASLYEAHQLPVDEQGAAAALALSECSAEWSASQLPADSSAVVVVWRNPWQLQMQCLRGAEADWMRMCCPSASGSAPAPSPAPEAHAQPCLAELLDKAPHDFDFARWLGLALSQGWLWRVDEDQA